MLRDAIKYKVTEAGGFFVEVPTQSVKPSQTCPGCGHQRKKELSERVHTCSNCGITCDRDVAAAQVMLQWALGTNVLNRRADSSTSSPTFCGGMKQLSATKRKKLSLQRSKAE